MVLPIPLPLAIIAGVAGGVATAVAVDAFVLRPERERRAAEAALQRAYEAGWAAGYELRDQGRPAAGRQGPASPALDARSTERSTLFDAESDSAERKEEDKSLPQPYAGRPPPPLPPQAYGPPPPPLPGKALAQGPPPPPLPTGRVAAGASSPLDPQEAGAILASRTAANATGASRALGAAPRRRRGKSPAARPDAWTSAMHAELDAVDQDFAASIPQSELPVSPDPATGDTEPPRAQEFHLPSVPELPTASARLPAPHGLLEEARSSTERNGSLPGSGTLGRPPLSRVQSGHSDAATSIVCMSEDTPKSRTSPSPQNNNSPPPPCSTHSADLSMSASWKHMSPPLSPSALDLGRPQSPLRSPPAISRLEDRPPPSATLSGSEMDPLSGPPSPHSGALSSESEWFALSPALSAQSRSDHVSFLRW